MHLHTNLKTLRGIKGYSCEVVANALGMPRSRLSGYENGAAEPNCTMLMALAAYYRVSVDALLGADLKNWPVNMVEQLQREYREA